ncbi:MAG TPA: cytochrome c peroxidase [Flavobacteriales bacterium]|nr:cytochrome c peroxidase [Flavobacteriales bacterium]
MYFFVFTGFIALLVFACNEKKTGNKITRPVTDEPVKLVYPDGFDTIHFPADNRLTRARIELGRKIFFDTQFSADKKIACSTCHMPANAFADNEVTHKGAHDSINRRNTPSLINIGLHPYYDYDGGVPTLELQVLVPFDGETEMHSNLLTAAELMLKDSTYVALSKKAYKRKPDPFVIVRALASYQRWLISNGSRYDLYKKTGKGFTAEEKAGMDLFNSAKTNCTKCHSGPLFSNFAFENIGLRNTSRDTGRIRVTLNPGDVGKFKTSPLRNVALTAPYMHDGSIKTLEDVIEFYNRGGDVSRNKSEWIKPLGLTKKEKKSLVAFLKTLTDTAWTDISQGLPHYDQGD